MNKRYTVTLIAPVVLYVTLGLELVQLTYIHDSLHYYQNYIAPIASLVEVATWQLDEYSERKCTYTM